MGARTEKVQRVSNGLAMDDRQAAWELGVSQSFTPSWTVYARVGRSFRLPNMDELLFLPTPLRPQVSRDAELGVRWTYSGGKVEARAYRSDLTDEIGFENSMFSNVNFDPTRRTGVEMDWAHALTRTLAVRFNGMVRSATFRSGQNAGNDVPLVPRRSVAVRVDWTPMAAHSVNGGVNWVSSQVPTTSNACRIPSYATADARYAWQFSPKAELGIGVSNLFDRKFYTQAFGCTADGQATWIYPEPGRQFTASLRVQF
jgi:iron complex outermembrane recepter protein